MIHLTNKRNRLSVYKNNFSLACPIKFSGLSYVICKCNQSQSKNPKENYFTQRNCSTTDT